MKKKENRLSPFVGVFGLILFSLSLGWGQDKPPIDTGIVEKVRVELVQFNILALDKRGNPVLDLKPEDLLLREGGVEQRIAFVERFSSRGGIVENQTLRSGNVAPAEVKPSEIPVANPAKSTRWIALVLDNFLTSQRTRAKAIEAVRQFLENDFREEDRVAVINFSGKVELLQPFTNDRGKLIEACSTANNRRATTVIDWEGQLETAAQQVEECQRKNDQNCALRVVDVLRNENRRNVDIYLSALTSVIRSLAPIPETKVMVLVSDGFPRDASQDGLDILAAFFSNPKGNQALPVPVGELETPYERLAQAAGEARVSIFPIYPSSIIKASGVSVRRGRPLDEIRNPHQVDYNLTSQKNRMQGLAEIAKRTGGGLVRTADPSEGLHQVWQSADGLYTVGFYPRGLDSTNLVHEIKLKAKRKGIDVKYASDILQPTLRPTLPGEMTVKADACENNRRRMLMSVRISRKALRFETVKKELAANFSVYLALQPDGASTPTYVDYRVFNLTTPEKADPEAKAEDPMLEQTMVVPCQGLTIKAVVSDMTSGAKASFSEYLTPSE